MAVCNDWRIPLQARLLWRRWPGEAEYVFYHGASGDTHRLSELAGQVMEQALAGPLNTAKLALWLAAQGDPSPEDTLDDLYATLAQLDFLEPVHASG